MTCPEVMVADLIHTMQDGDTLMAHSHILTHSTTSLNIFPWQLGWGNGPDLDGIKWPTNLASTSCEARAFAMRRRSTAIPGMADSGQASMIKDLGRYRDTRWNSVTF